jgi:CheY-like chemotaxis protein
MAPESSQPHRCSILVIDDDEELREMLRVALSAEGYHVAAVANGRDGLDYLRSHNETCVILLDLLLPVMDGIHFRTAQLHDRSLAWIPTIIMSGAFDADRTTRELGARRFVRKPVNLDEVRLALGQIKCQLAGPRTPESRVEPQPPD